MNFDTLLQKPNETNESLFPVTPGRMTVVFSINKLMDLFPFIFLQDPAEPAAAVRQLPAPVPAVTAQRGQDGGLCRWEDSLLRGPGGPGLWSQAIPLYRGSTEGP